MLIHVHIHVETSRWYQMASSIAPCLEHIEVTSLPDPRAHHSPSLAIWLALRISCLCPPQAGLTGNHYMWEPFLCKWSIAPSLEFIRDFIFYNHVNKSKWNGICCHQGSEIAKRLHSSGQLLSIGDLFLSVFWEWYPIHGDEQCDWLVMSVSGIEVEIHVWYINRGSTKLLMICIRSSIK